MSEETRRILKVFGIAVTDFQENQRQIMDDLSGGARGSAAADVLREACGRLLDLQEKWLEATHLVFDAQRSLLQEILETR